MHLSVKLFRSSIFASNNIFFIFRISNTHLKRNRYLHGFSSVRCTPPVLNQECRYVQLIRYDVKPNKVDYISDSVKHIKRA